MKNNIIYSIMLVMIIYFISLIGYSSSIDLSNDKSENIVTETSIIPGEAAIETFVETVEVVENVENVIEEEVKLEVVFNENDLNQISNITYEDMSKLLSDTTMSHLAGAIVDSEKTHGVNSFFTLSVIALESSWATSSRVTESNNLTGMAVYGDYSSGESYDTQYECVLETVRQIKKHYLLSDGMFYNGSRTIDVNVRYSANSNWYNIVNQISYEMMDKYNRTIKGD